MLDYNWKRFKYEENGAFVDVDSYSSSMYVTSGPSYIGCTANLIVLHNDDGQIFLINRWTLNIDKVFIFSTTETNWLVLL